MKKILIFAAIVVNFAACTTENEDVVKAPQKDGAVETTLTTKHFTGYDILYTEHKIWVKNQLKKTISTADTLQSLGTTKEEGEDNDGNTKDIIVPKDYEFYITVK